MLLNKLPTLQNCKRIGYNAVAIVLLSALTLMVQSCSTLQPTSKAVNEPASIRLSALPGFAEDDLKNLDTAIEQQCALAVPPAPWAKLCIEFVIERGNLKAWLNNRFSAWPLLATNGSAQGLITGYYEPLLTGSRKRETSQQTPLYKRPNDLLRVDPATAQSSSRFRAKQVDGQLRPYLSRAEIQNTDALKDQELLYLDDSVEAFFLEIQGSGRVQLREPNGQVTTVRVGFSDHNGATYKAIGQVLIESKAITRDEISAEKIKQWLRENPAQSKQVMQTNERFIFFVELPEGNSALGPKGALAVPLTADRSIATDPKFAALGSLMYLSTTTPLDGKALQRVVVSQDIGAAISGQVRADFFFGFGDDAGQKASAMKQVGQLWLLLPNDTKP
jgi:membrane-bound lytic murein transglycosylase A